MGCPNYRVSINVTRFPFEILTFQKNPPRDTLLKKSGIAEAKDDHEDVEDNFDNLDGAEQRNLPSFSTLIGKSNRKNYYGGTGPRDKRQNHGFGSLPGSGRKDFPSLSTIPITDFSCLDGAGPGGSSQRDAGFYADRETKCQVS